MKNELLGAVLTKSLEGALENAGDIVLNHAKELLSGDKKNCVKTDAEGLTVTVYAEGEEARKLEFGTSKMAAQPFLVPSLISSEEEILKAISDGLEIL